MPAGRRYTGAYERSRVFSMLPSGLSRAGYFHIDSEPPVAAASSPQYSKSNAFDVCWTAEDPAARVGAGASAPYDVQYKIDDGEWTDWLTGTNRDALHVHGGAGARLLLQGACGGQRRQQEDIQRRERGHGDDTSTPARRRRR